MSIIGSDKQMGDVGLIATVFNQSLTASVCQFWDCLPVSVHLEP